MTLSNVDRFPTTVKIDAINNTDAATRAIRLGLCPGLTVEVTGRVGSKGSYLLRFYRQELAIGNKLAGQILVELPNAEKR